jgi:aryl-alcohol dehydrogenase-like predicted oxidoreductase
MQYSLICRDIEHSVTPVCERYHIGILPWSPLGQGVLTGKYSADGKGPSEARFGQEPKNEAAARWRARYLNERSLALTEVVKEVAKDLETTPVALSIAWLLRRPQVTSVIIGPRSVDQLEGNLAGGEVEIPDDAMARLDEASAPDTPYPEAFQEMSPRLAH